MAQQQLTKNRQHAWPNIKCLLALLAIFVMLVLPNRSSLLLTAAWCQVPLELGLLAGVLLLPARLGQFWRVLATGFLALGVLLKLTDIGTYQAFGRDFNPVLDGHFLRDGMQFLQGSVGWFAAYLSLMMVLCVLLALVVLIYRALGSLQGLLSSRRRAAILGLPVALLLWLLLYYSGWQLASAPLYTLLCTHSVQTLSSIADLATFNQLVTADPYAQVPEQALFSRLKGKDVLVLFVESYGSTVLEQAEYANRIRPVLAQGSAKLVAANIHARSAYITSPTYGGISWLAHGTLLSGLWVNSQTRYDRLVMSQRATLNRLFQRAGWRTVTLQPAHTMAWPQGAYFGYDQIYAANDLGYQGQPFNWITMPDQYTLAAFQSRERPAGARKPVMAEIALISSHAPWTPLPQLVAWENVGDGRLFTQQAQVGDTPEVVWQNTARIREQYGKAIEYSLTTIISYLLQYADEQLVVLVLGDHQPAPFVTYESARHEVIAHLFSCDANVMAAVEDWQWTPGLLPADTAPVWPMDQLRERFIHAFSSL